jgi:hypothetical protein
LPAAFQVIDLQLPTYSLSCPGVLSLLSNSWLPRQRHGQLLGLVLLDRLGELPPRKQLQKLRKNAAYWSHG